MNTSQVHEFMEDLESTQDYSAHTLKSYYSDLIGFAQWFEETNDEPFTVKSITSLDLKEYIQHIEVKLRYKPSTINRKIAAMRTFLTWAYQKKLIDSPVYIPKFKKVRRDAPQWLDKKQQHALLRKAEKTSQRDYAVILLLLNTGLRVSELCSLEWGDIEISPRKGKLYIRNGKGGVYREVPLNLDARKALAILKDLSESNNYVLIGQRGPLSPRGVQFMIKRLIRGIPELEDVTIHHLRHTFCKNLINAGIGIEKVARLAGHESLESTRIYCEPSKQELQQAVEDISYVFS